MKNNSLFVVLLSLFSAFSFATDENISVKENLEGLKIPEEYKNWRVISASHRTDNKSMRIILGNDIAIEAARSNQTNPWPDGAILGKLVWKQTTEKNWPTAITPDEFIHAEFMYKDSKKFKSNGTGWGWARWLGKEQKPYGDENDLNQSCIACHTPVKENDWVYTTPVQLP
ncbi:cytochrome P460 family protein [Gilvimarinus chinensis]|uniref:cytochrome P460 family protein n=1 Tax=Gilvimarinus chinensis TaxID=396005 RepID=UPI00038249CF|nr:cytochrome P460 family protein [Gilvimarinus chinensis]